MNKNTLLLVGLAVAAYFLFGKKTATASVEIKAPLSDKPECDGLPPHMQEWCRMTLEQKDAWLARQRQCDDMWNAAKTAGAQAGVVPSNVKPPYGCERFLFVEK
jgi:hypothetical protein